ncbi:MAG: hypothetical protein OEY89_01430 [Gammaproteobacteria bacterium]|nr:hypothetical protein [Gammaproteobacteria bacterium]
MENTQNRADDNSAQQINKLYILVNVMENIIIKTKDPQYRHHAKKEFNALIRHTKRLNRFLNEQMGEDEIEGLDELSHEIECIFDKYI